MTLCDAWLGLRGVSNGVEFGLYYITKQPACKGSFVLKRHTLGSLYFESLSL